MTLLLTFFFVLVFKFKFLAFFFFWNHGEKELERSIYESSNVLKRRSKIIKVFPGISFDYFMHARKPICIFSCLTPTEGMMNLSLNGKGLLVCEFRVRLFYYSIIWFRSGYLSCHNRGPPGDLYVYLDVQEIPGIQRDDINLVSIISISYLDAIVGAVVKVN